MIFSVFLRASSKRLTSLGKRISSGAQVASTISVPLFFSSDSKKAEGLSSSCSLSSRAASFLCVSMMSAPHATRTESAGRPLFATKSACLRRPYRISRIRVLFWVSGTSRAFQVHGFLGILAIFRALYEFSIASIIILYKTLDVFKETLNKSPTRGAIVNLKAFLICKVLV